MENRSNYRDSLRFSWGSHTAFLLIACIFMIAVTGCESLQGDDVVGKWLRVEVEGTFNWTEGLIFDEGETLEFKRVIIKPLVVQR